LYCGITRHCLLLRKVGDLYKNDPRYGTRAERMSRNARIDIGRRFAELCAATFQAVKATVEAAENKKTERRRKIQEALSAEPLKVPGRSVVKTAGGTTITTFANPPTPTRKPTS
jgi:hypothetical protein